MGKERSSFSGKIGFVLAAAGSAVGLGNIWRFPYLAAKYGGGIFLLIYLVLAIVMGFALMSAEIAIGRKTGLSAIGAFRKLDRRFGFLGYMAALVPILVLPYYSVIGGWVSKYFFAFITGGAEAAAADGYFKTFIAKPFEPIGWFLLFIGLTALVVLLGVEKGIEKVSKVMMPALLILTIAIAAYSIFLPGAMDGVIYFLKPDFSHFSAVTVLSAMGQLFYSMSIAMGIMITYGSYMKKDVNLETSVLQIELFDAGIAILAGLMIIPPVFAFSGGNTEALSEGPGLMFVTLPKVFESMTGGAIIGAAFFLMVFFAALTSSISLMETVVSICLDKLKWGRKITTVGVLLFSLLLGIPCSLGHGPWSGFTIIGMNCLDFCDFITNNVLMPVVALITCIFVGYVLKPKTVIDEIEISSPFRLKKLFVFSIKLFAPLCILLILISSALDVLGILSI